MRKRGEYNINNIDIEHRHTKSEADGDHCPDTSRHWQSIGFIYRSGIICLYHKKLILVELDFFFDMWCMDFYTGSLDLKQAIEVTNKI